MSTNSGLEYVTCGLCGEDDTEKVFDVPVRSDQIGIYVRDSWPVVRCRRCGLVYVNPRIDAAARNAYYEFKNPVDFEFVHAWFVNNADLQRATWQRFLRVIQRYCLTGRLLDVGCGTGSFLIEAQNSGYTVLGQEVAPYFVKFCRAQHGLTVYEGDLGTLTLDPASFDCVTAFDVIEHHPNPRQMLRQIRRLLKPGGVIVISTHDIGNFFARLYGRRWRHMNPIGHLTFFTRPTLAKLLVACGFRVQQSGGLHTIDTRRSAEWRRRVLQFLRVILLRTLILALYKPVAEHLPLLRRWEFKWNGNRLTHDKLLVRAGKQIIIDDDMVFLAEAI